MRQKLLLLLLGVLSALSALALDFEYTYEGQTVIYTVIDDDAKTCKTKEGITNTNGELIAVGNAVSGDLLLPASPKYGDVEYTLTSIGRSSFDGCSGLTSVEIPNYVTSIV